MKRSQAYLKRAEDAERLAKSSAGGFRQDMQQIARQWRALALRTAQRPPEDLREPDDS